MLKISLGKNITDAKKLIQSLKSKQQQEKSKGKACAITKLQEVVMWLENDEKVE